MIAALLLALQVSASPPPVAPVAPVPSPPAAMAGVPPLAEWPSLPVYPVPRQASDGSAYVRAEVEAGRCVAAFSAGPDNTRIVAAAAILVGPGGVVRRIVPRAIGCPTVEQFTVGYLSSLARGRSNAAPPLPSGWYHATMAYRW